MRIRQHASFAIFSEQLTASDVTARLGVEPDDFMVRGSRSTDPVIPRWHVWEIRCDQGGMSVGEQIAAVISRVAPHQEAIAQLLRSGKEGPGGSGVLQVVRYFDDEDGTEESPRSMVLENGEELERVPGQHQLLGWHLESDVIAFLHAVGADLDVDEYG